jgi:PAS domain S-box-containing protein/putative nucleotidyltransferase with HDIG domain
MKPPVRLLLFEDNPGDARLVKEALVEAGAAQFELSTAKDLAGGLAHLAGHAVDAILLDLTLPDSFGFDTFKRVNEQASQIPIILLTGLQDEELAAEAVRQGAQDYLIKGKADGALLARAIRYGIERKRTEKLLQEGEQKYRRLVDNASESILVAQDGMLKFANRMASELSGYPEQELISRPFAEFIYPVDRDKVMERYLNRIKGESSQPKYAFRFVAGNGSIRWVEISGVLIDWEGKPATLNFLNDITERKQAEAALARQTEELRQRNEELARLYRASGSLLSGSASGIQELGQAILGVVQQEFGQANCSLLLVHKGSNELQRLAVAGPYAGEVKNKVLALDGTGLAPRAIRTGTTLNVGNVRAMPNYLPNWEAAQSELTVPLKIGSEVIGAIDIQSAQPDAFNANDERLMATFAERAALALAHSRLNEQTKARVQQLAALRTIDMAISSSFDINLTLGILLTQLSVQLGVHAADILVYNASAQTLRFSCGKGFRTQALQHTRLRLGEGFAGRVALEGRVLKIANLRADPTGFKKSPLIFGEEFVAYEGVPLVAKGQIKGVLEILQREPLDFTAEEQAFLEILAGQAAIAIDNAELFDHLQSSVVDLNIAYDSTLEGWSRALDLRDKETEGHTLRVTELAEHLGRAMGIGDADLVQMRRGALLHDIGKMAVPDHILFKPGKLTDEEWAIMRQHPQHAYDMLSPIAYLRPALDIPYAHHEKWDGSGYPRGLKGEQIPLAARIFAVVDVWDGIISARSYHPAQPEAVALEYIRSSAGTHFDPRVVAAFLGMER